MTEKSVFSKQAENAPLEAYLPVLGVSVLKGGAWNTGCAQQVLDMEAARLLLQRLEVL
jgi:hypothetical protein